MSTRPELPPYGTLHRDHQIECDQPLLPRLWPQASGMAGYRSVLRALLGDIREGLWPTWDAARQEWMGGAAAGRHALTEHDLRLMEPLYDLLASKVSSQDGAPEHRTLFAWEDGRGGLPGFGLEGYYEGLAPSATGWDPYNIFPWGIASYCGSAAILVKADLQRPRAYQCATLLGRDDFRRLYASTADTPSMVSGHCLEGCMGGAYTAMKLKENAPGLDWGKAEPALLQWTVDIGDRRVMAHVHYPSDNIASWWVALGLLGVLEAMQAPGAAWMLAFLRKAIPLSHVFRRIDADPPPDAPLWPRLRERLFS